MDITTAYTVVVVLLLNLGFGRSSVKVWRHDEDIHNPENWVDGKAQKDCDGLDLSHDFMISKIDDLNVKKITLPNYGRIDLMEDGRIEFDEHSLDVMNCVRRNSKSIGGFWADPTNWIMQSDDENVAVPHVERIPCVHDDVVFPKGWKTCIVLFDGDKEVKSVKFGRDYLDSEDFRQLQTMVQSPFSGSVHISGEACLDPTGCVCQNDLENSLTCSTVNVPFHFDCLDPIMPIGFCVKTCGARILFRPKSNFRLDNVRRSIRGYSSDTYVSKVLNGSTPVIQIVFAEKQFAGTSLEEARDYYWKLSSDGNLEAQSVEIYSSGPHYVEGEATSITLSIVFGSLCGVLLVFGLLFLLYSPRFAALNLGTRYLPASRPLLFKSNVFARYDNSENVGLLLGRRQSLTGSAISLDKSFDNPMFGKSPPSTASTSASGGPDEKIGRSEICLENPMYDVSDAVENVQEATEAELVDL